MSITPVITAQTPEAEATLTLARRFLEAVNTRNEEALIDTVSEDAVYILHADPTPPVHGHEGFRHALAALNAVWADYNFVTHSILAEPNLFVAEWTMTGTLAMPLPIGTRVAVPDGRLITFKGVDICPVAGGKVTAKISYVDATAWYEQLSFEG